MKKTLRSFLAALAATTIAAALPTDAMAETASAVTVTKFHQSYPYSGRATVEYTVGVALPANAFTEITIRADGASATFVQSNIVTGANTNVIDFASSFGGALVLTNASFTVTLNLGGVQLWENGPYWAECNVGASEPEEFGYYFWWGDTVGYTRSGGTWAGSSFSGVTWVSSTGQQMGSSPFSSSSCPTMDKDNSTLQSEGWIDATTNLVAAHDAATAHLGAPWRMPTDAEFSALTNNCTTTWITTNGVSGRLVTGMGAYANNSIFLPAAGCGDNSALGYPDSIGVYWFSAPRSDSSGSAWCLLFNSGSFARKNNKRYFGQSVRPVRGFEGYSASGVVTYYAPVNLPVVIESVDDWNELSAAVAGGLATEGMIVRLANDIGPVTNPVGTPAQPFAGVFDGGSNTLTLALSGSDSYLAPFSTIEGATIRNLKVAGTVSGALHCSGLVGCIVDGISVIENCEVAATISCSGSHFGGFIGHSVMSTVTLRGCVFSGSLSGGTYVATFHGWSDDGATTTLIDCLDASESSQPIGRGTDAACVSNTYYLASKDFRDWERLWSPAKRGKRAYSVTAGEGVIIDFGAPAATYAATGLAAYSPGLAYDDAFYAGQGDAVRLDLAATPPSGMAVDAYVASAGTLSRTGNAWTLAMPDGPVVVSANWTPDITRSRVQLWKGGPYWAECNVGASHPWESGYYFWWGDTVGYRRENNAWMASDGSTTNFSFGSANTPTYGKDNATLQSEGWITADGVLALEHDAARVYLGDPWRMPTDAEFSALNDYCDWKWTTTNGVSGYVVSGRDGYSSASIFLPAAGFVDRTSLSYAGSEGYYWSSVPYESNSESASALRFFSDYHGTYYDSRGHGFSVRPVWVPIDLSMLTADYTAQDGDVMAGETTYTVSVPAGATVTINGVAVAGVGGGTVNPAPAFASGGEAVTTKFEQGAGDTWVITAFAELANDAVGADVPDDAITVYRGDAVGGVTNAIAPTITEKKSAVKVEMTVDAPAGAPAQFFKVKFGE